MIFLMDISWSLTVVGFTHVENIYFPFIALWVIGSIIKMYVNIQKGYFDQSINQWSKLCIIFLIDWNLSVIFQTCSLVDLLDTNRFYLQFIRYNKWNLVSLLDCWSKSWFCLSNIATVVDCCNLLLGDDMVNLWQAVIEHVCKLLKWTWKMACEKSLKKVQ